MQEYLTAGEKIKRLRKSLGLKQEDLTDETVSKSLISMIEKGKRGLTLQVAQVIAESFNMYYEQIGQTVTAEYLMEPVEEQMRKEILKDLELLKKGVNSGRADVELVKNTFNKVMDLIQKGDFQKELIELKIVRGNFYYENYQYKEALQDYLDVLDYNMRLGDYGQVARTYILLGTTYQMMWVMDSAIAHFIKAYDTAMAHNTTNQERIKAQSIFNQIICYCNIKRYDLALTHVDIFKKIKWDDPLYKVYTHRVLLTEASIYRDLTNHYSAEQVYKSLFSIEKKLDDETLFLLYENYGLYHRNLGNRENALAYFKKANQLKEKVNIKYLPALYLYQSTCYNLKEEYEELATLLEDGLKLADMISRKNMMIEIRFAFVEVFIRLKDYDSALQQLRIVDKLLQEIVAKPLLHDSYSYYIEVYNRMGEIKKSNEYAYKLRQKSYLGY